MSGTVTIWGDSQRRFMRDILDRLPVGWRVTYAPPKRTKDQNAKMWAMLAEFAEQAEHRGNRYNKDQWKAIFMQSLGHEVQFLPDLDGQIFPAGHRSSRLTVAQMSALIEMMHANAARFDVQFKGG